MESTFLDFWVQASSTQESSRAPPPPSTPAPSSTTPKPLPARLCYLALCAGGAITSVGLSYANVTDTSTLPAWLAGGLWIVVGIVFTAATTAVSPPTRRGFGSRWTTMIIVWVILWTITSFFNERFTLGLGAAMAAAFLVTAVIGLKGGVK